MHKGTVKNIPNYKKPTFWVVCVAVVAVIVASMCLLTNPQRITLPDGETVQTIEMEQFNEGSSLGFVTITDKGDIVNVLSNLSGAKKTMRQSTNDYPILDNYLIVRLVLAQERRTLCLYSDGGNYYIEEPYVGIYKSDRDTSVAIYKVYTGSDTAFSGYYAFDECLYMNPLSSFYPFEGTGYFYIVGENSFSVIDEDTGKLFETISPHEWNGQNISENEWAAMFVPAISVPDISEIDYHSRTMYVLSDKYRLFNMNGEIWLAQLNGDKMWGLYRLLTKCTDGAGIDVKLVLTNDDP